MAKLSRIWDVTISLGTLAINEHSFNDILILWSDNNGFSSGNKVEIVTSTDDLDDLGISTTSDLYEAVTETFSQTPRVSQVYVGWQDSGSSETVKDALDACVTQAPGYWYGLALASKVRSEVEDAASWAEANDRLFGTSSNNSDIPTSATTDIASELQQNNYLRSFVVYTKSSDIQYPELALMSNRFTYYPGQASWANTRLHGVKSDNLTETEYNFCKGKNVTTFENFRNFAITQGGKVAGDEWIDVIRLRDQLVEAIKVSVVGAIVRATNSTGKIPYTDGGIQIIANAIRQPLDLDVRRGGIAPPELDDNGDVIPSYKISVPKAADVSDNDKANRVLKDCYFTARLAGAIHSGELKGSLVYSF